MEDIEIKREKPDHEMNMDELAMFWSVRTDEFGTELSLREETGCCGINFGCRIGN